MRSGPRVCSGTNMNILLLALLWSAGGEWTLAGKEVLTVLITAATKRDGQRTPGGPDRWTINYLYLVGNSPEGRNLILHLALITVYWCVILELFAKVSLN